MITEKRTDNSISDRIVELLNTHFGLKCDSSANMLDKPLTGQPYELSGMEIYQLLMLIEEEYCVYFLPDDIRKYGFDTINNIVHMVLMYT